ncbi:MAG: UvrD-helicase domain-containing protein, partial [Pseudomonadota bacterium]
DFADGLLGGLDQAKDSRGLLDFQDLVTRARHLLTDRDMRAWVLYKLDQGIDHILVDEAQDTSPEQWAIIQAIADEFLSGEGARPAGRSIFVVGDEKQSIYSFQGAEPRAFGRMRDWFDDRLAQIGPPLGQPRLETSYRSAPAILNFVDAVFQGDVGRGLTATGEPVRHLAHRSEAWGRVDLWPLVDKPAGADEAEWWEPVDKPPPAHPKRLLADKVAEQIGHILLHEHLPGRDGAAGQKVRPQDIMVLLAGRRPLAPWLIRGLKARGIPVAGADRLALTAELAVQDLMAVMRIVTLPSDDLSLAALLRSPLCGLTEEELFNLAHRRAGTLWQSVDASDHTNTKAFLSEIVNAADYERPYEFLERVLGTHDGRRKLLARLGPEAEEAIDELLVQALVFETHEVPSLAGFLTWLEAGDIQVKREMDRGQDAVRVMTVHGAKGLEAPIVILPDTVSGGGRARGGANLLKLEGSGNTPDLIVWAGSKTQDDPITAQARADQEDRAQAERARLLYVALTRAEDWLILAGARLDRESADSWYPLLTAGMERLAADEGLVKELSSPTGAGVMRRFEIGTRPAEVPTRDEVSAEPETLSKWLKPAAIEPRVERGAPSGLGKGLDKHTAGSGLDPATARLRGSAIHLALEHLPAMPTPERPAAGEELLAHAFPSLSAGLRKDALAEALRTLGLPFASQVFGPESLAEVTVAIDAPDGGRRMIGRIDRLIPGDAQILLVDIKTDGAPPAKPDDVPHAYLAQLGAYASAVRPSWPDQHLQLAILWTASAEIMAVDAHTADQKFREAKFARTGRA